MAVNQVVPELWKCDNCHLFNFMLVSKCQACFESKIEIESTCTFNLKKSYDDLSDKDLSEIIMKCDEQELKDIFKHLEFKNAIYQNHSFLSLLIDIGKINLIFMLFEKNYKFPLNYAPKHDHEKSSQNGNKTTKYCTKNEILPLSMAFEKDEIYLIKLLLRAGADPNQLTDPKNVGLHREWDHDDLYEHKVYLHYLPISIPIRKVRDGTITSSMSAEYQEIFDLLIASGSLWYEDDYLFKFSNKDASFWIEFLTAFDYRSERFYIKKAMNKHWNDIIEPELENSCIHEVKSLIQEYFVEFPPMIDISVYNDNPDYNNDNVIRIYAKILKISESENSIVQQFEYLIRDQFDNPFRLLIYDERLFDVFKVGDIIQIRDPVVLRDSDAVGINTNNDDNDNDDGYAHNVICISHQMTLTPPISISSPEFFPESI